jgi:hypothetical protein
MNVREIIIRREIPGIPGISIFTIFLANFVILNILIIFFENRPFTQLLYNYILYNIVTAAVCKISQQ